MNKKTLLGLSAIFLALGGALVYSNCAGSYGISNNQGGSVQRADAPLPPLPWPWGLSVPSNAIVS